MNETSARAKATGSGSESGFLYFPTMLVIGQARVGQIQALQAEQTASASLSELSSRLSGIRRNITGLVDASNPPTRDGKQIINLLQNDADTLANWQHIAHVLRTATDDEMRDFLKGGGVYKKSPTRWQDWIPPFLFVPR
jgi:hypothetical protein